MLVKFVGIKVRIFKTIGDYVGLKIEAENAVAVINLLSKSLSKGGEDVRDSIRMIEHFDTFYDLMRRKFKDYLTPRKDIGDILKKRVLIDKIKLIKKDNERTVEIVFDKSIKLDDIKSVLVNNGIEVEVS